MPNLLIKTIISQIINQGVMKIIDIASREKKVLEVLEGKLKQLPDTFEWVYILTYVRYCQEQPDPILKMFQEETVQDACREAFLNQDYSIFASKADKEIEALSWGDEITELKIDYQKKLKEFYDLLFDISKHSQKVPDVLLSKQIEEVKEDLTQIISEVKEEVRELRKVVKNNDKSQNSQFSQDLKSWLKALKYEFEDDYQECGDGYFQWIIQTQSDWGYERILVRGVEGEAEINDVKILLTKMSEKRIYKGFLFAYCRVSPSARQEVAKTDNIACFTFDEFIENKAKFTKYFAWLEDYIKTRTIDTLYVPLACRKEEIDSNTKQKLGISIYGEQEGWIEGYIDRWLDDPVKEHISILGEFGTGKTWFVFHYAWQTLQKYKEAQKKGTQRPRLPLVIPLRDYAKAVTVESLLSEFCFRKHEIGLPGYTAFEQLNRMGKLLLIFDGFDEMADRVDLQKMINNFWELAKVIVPGAKAILTCRNEHFPEAQEGRALLNAELKASTSNLTGEPPQFEILELEKFNDEQIRAVLVKRTNSDTIERIMSNSELLDLARRPLMVELILEAIPEIEAGKPIDISRIYWYAVRRKLDRDIKEERTFTAIADKIYFMCELAYEMLSTDQMSLNYRLFPGRIRRCFSREVQEQKDLDHWHYDMMGQNVLIRNSEGDYMPAHRSLLEFFVAYKFAVELGVLAADFYQEGDLDRFNINPTPVGAVPPCLPPQRINETTTSINGKRATKEGATTGGLPLRETFGKQPLTKAVLDLLIPMLEQGEQTQARLMELVTATKGKTPEDVGYIGGNAVTVLLKIDPDILENITLENTVLLGGDFTTANLHNTNFTNANLEKANFANAHSLISSVAFSPDLATKYVATGEADSNVYLWQLSSDDTLNLIRTFQGSTDWVYSVAFSPNGEILASGNADETIRLWNINTGDRYKDTLRGHQGRIYSVAFSPSGNILASGSDDHTIKLWDLNLNKQDSFLKTLKGHQKRINSVVFIDENYLASGSHDGTIKLWDMNSGECIDILAAHEVRIYALAYNPQQELLASGGDDTTIKLWKINLEKSEVTLFKTYSIGLNLVTSIVFSTDGKKLLTGSEDQTVKILDLDSGRFGTLISHTSRVNSVALSPDGNTVISGGNDQALKICKINPRQCCQTLQGNINWVYSVAFSPDGEILASGSKNQTIKLWNWKETSRLKTLRGHTEWIRGIAWSPDGQKLASVSDDIKIKLWDVKSGECSKTLSNGHSNRILAVAFSHNGKILASGSRDTTIRLWDIESGDLKVLKGHKRRVRSVAFSNDDTIIASCGNDATVKIWDVNTGKCKQTLHPISEEYEHRKWVFSVCFSPDDRILASAGDDNMITLWKKDIHSEYKKDKILTGHQKELHSIAISPNGEILASGGCDKVIKLWNIKTGEFIKDLTGHENWIISIAFHPNQDLLASGSYDETIKIWDINTGKCITTLDNRPYVGMNITGVKGLSEAEKATLKALGAVEL